MNPGMRLGDDGCWISVMRRKLLGMPGTGRLRFGEIVGRARGGGGEWDLRFRGNICIVGLRYWRRRIDCMAMNFAAGGSRGANCYEMSEIVHHLMHVVHFVRT